MKEIVYSETRDGHFEPAPTRAEKRHAKLAAEKRAKRIETFWGVIAITIGIVGYAALFTVYVFSDKIWPIVRP